MGLEVEVVGETNKFDVIVIGGGIAGMIASSTVTKEGLKSCFLEKDVPGGKLMFLDKIHNFPPQPGIPGKDLALSVFRQATEEIKTNYVYGDVKAIKPKNGKFYLFTADGQTWEAKALIIATGTVTRKLNVKGEDQYFGKGVTYCVLCDAGIVKGMNVALVGSPLHLEALKQSASHVDVLKPEDVKEITGDGNRATGIVKADGTKVPYDYIFIENGFTADLSFLPNDIMKNDKNEVMVDENMANSFEGVYACGDCANKMPKMIEPAMSQAAIAGVNAANYVKSKNW